MSVFDRLQNDAAFREEICAWMRAIGVDPDSVPMDATVSVADGNVTVDVWIRSEDGRLRVDEATRATVKTTVTVPMTVEPTPAVHEWIGVDRPTCPTCGRAQ